MFKSFDVIEEPERLYEDGYIKKHYDVCPALFMQRQRFPENRMLWKDGIAKWCYCGLKCEWCTLTAEQARELSLSKENYTRERIESIIK